MNDQAPSRRPVAVPLLLALIVLSQLTIANEIRFQGCVSNQFALAQVAAETEAPEARIDFDCSRVPLI